jgi:hypothetical protein
MAVNGTCKQVFNNQLSRKKQFKKKNLNNYTPRLDHTSVLLVLKSQIPATFLGRK